MAGLPDVGSQPAVLEPRLYVANRGSGLPGPIDGPLRMDWGEAWAWIPYTANGTQITPANPKAGYPTDEAGEIAQFNAGTETVTWTFQARTPSSQLLQWLGGFRRTEYAERARKETLSVTTGANAAGDITITLEDVVTVVSVLAGDTPSQVAAKVITAYAGSAVQTAVQGASATEVVFTQAAPHMIPDGTATPRNVDMGATGATASFAASDPGFQGYRKRLVRFNLDPGVNNEFMCGIEGAFADHSLEAKGGNVRSFAYRALNTENPQVVARKSGADAPIQPVATLRCLPEVIPESQYKPSGMPEVDEYGRWDMIFI